jgi:hypothetical protein
MMINLFVDFWNYPAVKTRASILMQDDGRQSAGVHTSHALKSRLARLGHNGTWHQSLGINYSHRNITARLLSALLSVRRIPSIAADER